MYKCTKVQMYKCKNNFLSRAPPIGNRVNLFEVAKVLPACPSDTSSSKINMTMDHWYNDTDSRGNRSTALMLLCTAQVSYGLA
jgi:hypothetical protein